MDGGGSPFHEVDHIDDARCTDHGLVSEDGSHGLFHTELWLQGRQKRLNLLPEWKETQLETHRKYTSRQEKKSKASYV